MNNIVGWDCTSSVDGFSDMHVYAEIYQLISFMALGLD